MHPSELNPAVIQAISLSDIQAAAQKIAGVAHRTPVVTCSQLDHLAGAKLFFKCEQFQKVGAFKFRGAYNAVAQVAADPSRAQRGVITH
jgi:threonine dehydratase